MAALGSRALLPGLGVFSEAVHGSNASEGGAPLQKNIGKSCGVMAVPGGGLAAGARNPDPRSPDKARRHHWQQCEPLAEGARCQGVLQPRRVAPRVRHGGGYPPRPSSALASASSASLRSSVVRPGPGNADFCMAGGRTAILTLWVRLHAADPAMLFLDAAGPTAGTGIPPHPAALP